MDLEAALERLGETSRRRLVHDVEALPTTRLADDGKTVSFRIPAGTGTYAPQEMVGEESLG